MSTMATDFSKKIVEKKEEFCCNLCDYICFKKHHLKQHYLTKKHINKISNQVDNSINQVDNSKDEQIVNTKFICVCGKHYADKSGLWKHKKKCTATNNNEVQSEDIVINDNNDKNNVNIKDISQKDIVLMLLNQNTEIVKNNTDLKNIMLEQMKVIGEFMKEHCVINSHNSNCNNKSFNLNILLNETCKNAMNIMDFANSIQLKLTDLENIGELGYVEGISKIIIDNLKLLDITERPVHCSDFKRDVIYVKDNNKWEKEGDNNIKMKKLINSIANKNIPLISLWKKQNPDCYKSDSSNSTKINKMIMEVMETDDSKKDKIIKKIAKEVTINK